MRTKKILWAIVVLSVILLSGCKKQIEELPIEVENLNTEETISKTTEETPEKGIVLRSDLDFRDYISMNKQLKGEELLSSIEDQGLEGLIGKQSLLLESKLLMNYEGQILEGSSLAIYDPAGRTYNESSIAGLNNRILQLDIEGERYTYTYLEGEKTGILQRSKIEGENKESEKEQNQDRILDFYDPSYFQLIDAHMEFYQGQEVIYYEIADRYDTKSVMKTWFSLEYYMPLLEQAFYEGILVQEMEVQRVEVNQILDESYFLVPNDIEFVEE